MSESMPANTQVTRQFLPAYCLLRAKYFLGNFYIKILTRVIFLLKFTLVIPRPSRFLLTNSTVSPRPRHSINFRDPSYLVGKWKKCVTLVGFIFWKRSEIWKIVCNSGKWPFIGQNMRENSSNRSKSCAIASKQHYVGFSSF